ncbi:hypothetical protein M0804_002568 [Polistes exclamans]|nr:hypothetical protein M0804_002568 [Polistes exclamans]
MLSSFSSFDDELLNGAYANISLIADQTWVFNKQDLYRDLNQSLWIQSCKLIEKYKDKGATCPKHVRDVIPESRLSKYDSDTIGKNAELSEYNKYKPPRYTIDAPTEIQLQACISCENVRDFWNPMKMEQQQQQQKLFVTPNKRLHYQQRQQPQQCNRQEQRVNVCKGQQQLYCAVQYQPLALKMDYHQTTFQTDGYEIMRKPLAPNLSPEVPEFFPKFPVACLNNHKEQRVNPVQYFPSLNEKSYQKELFPYNRTYETVVVTSFQNVPIPMLPSIDTNHYMRTPHQWIQRVTAPGQIHIPVTSATQPIYRSLQTTYTNTINQRPQQVTPKAIPVYQRPLELYTDPSQIRKNNQGVDFNNLILLTKNAMKVRRSSSRNRQQPKQSKQSKKKTEQNIFQWLNKSCPKKSKELISVNTVVTELENFEKKCDCNKIANKWKGNETLGQKQITEHLKSNAWTMMENTDGTPTISSNETDMERDLMQNKKRLYRDVLTHTLTLSHIKLKI